MWEQISSARVTISALHQDVSGALTRMGIPHEIEYLTQDNLFSMDIALRGRKVAIEVDGPSHFCANMRSERLGSDRLRERFLAHKGWNVSVLISLLWIRIRPGFLRRRGDAKTFG